MKSFIHDHRRSLIGFGLMAALGAGAVAVAQPTPPRPPDAPAARMVEDREAIRDEHLARRAAMRERFERGREARLESAIAYMKTRLGITEAQEPLWNAFAEALRNNIQERVEARPEPRDPDAAAPTILERLEREKTRLAARYEHLDATAEALVPLYDAFDAEQKEIADHILHRSPPRRMAMYGGFGPPGQRGMRTGPRNGPAFDAPRSRL